MFINSEAILPVIIIAQIATLLIAFATLMFILWAFRKIYAIITGRRARAAPRSAYIFILLLSCGLAIAVL